MRSRKRKWPEFLWVPAILFGLVFTNYYIDPAGLYHNDSEAIAQALLRGEEAYFGSGNGSEREVKHHLILGFPDTVDCIAVGPSLVMGVRAKMTGTESFYNLGESGADFYDILAQFGLLELNGKKTKRIIFCVDSYFFDKTLYDTFTRNAELKPYAEYMLSLLNGENPKEPKADQLADFKIRAEQLFSVSYFQSAVDFIQAQNSYLLQTPRWGIVDSGFDPKQQAYYEPDGSWVYDLEYQKKGTAFVKQEAESYSIEQQFSKGGHISRFSMDTFEQLIQYYHRRDVEIDLYLCPLAPALWDRLEAEHDEYFVLDELEAYADYIARKYDLKITGSYNPYTLGMTNADFYDCRHVVHEKLPVFFDFTKKN